MLVVISVNVTSYINEIFWVKTTASKIIIYNKFFSSMDISLAILSNK